MDEKLEQLLRDYVATANSGKYKNLDEVYGKFPELHSYDKELLRDYVATANSGKYKNLSEVNAKFPEFTKTEEPKVDLSQYPEGKLPEQGVNNNPFGFPTPDFIEQTIPATQLDEVQITAKKPEKFQLSQEQLQNASSVYSSANPDVKLPVFSNPNKYSLSENQLQNALATYQAANPNVKLPTLNEHLANEAQISEGDAGRDSLTKFADAAGISTLSEGFGKFIYEPLAGATTFVDDVIGDIYTGVTGKKYTSQKGGLFDNLAENARRDGERSLTVRANSLGDGTVSSDLGRGLLDVGHGVVSAVPLIMATTATGGESIAAATPQYFSSLVKFLTASKALSGYGTSRNEGATTGESLVAAGKEGLKGAVEGYTIEAQMMLGKGVTQKLFEKGYLKGGEVTQKLFQAIGVGSTFGATSVGDNLLNGQPINWRDAAVQFGTGFAFEAPAVGKAIGNKIALDAKVSKDIAERNKQNKIANFIKATPDQIDAIFKLNKSADDLRAESVELGVKAIDAKDEATKNQQHLSQVALQNAADIKELTANISKDPSKFIEGIRSSDLPNEVKSQLEAKVEQVYRLYNPTEVQKTEIADRIKESEQVIEQTEQTAKISNDPVAKSELEVQKQEAEANIQQDQYELNKIVAEQSGAPVVAPKNILEAFKGGEQGITDYKEVVKQRLLAGIKESRRTATSGFNPESVKALLEYAVLSIADGTIKSAKALSTALGLKHSKEIDDIYYKAVDSAKEYEATNPDFVRAKERQGEILVNMQDLAKKANAETDIKPLVDYAKKVYDGGTIKTVKDFQDFIGVKNKFTEEAFNRAVKGGVEASVEAQKTSTQAPIKEVVKAKTEGKITGTTTISNRDALVQHLKTLSSGIGEGIKKGVKDTRESVKTANKELGKILNNLLTSNGKDKISNSTHQRLVTELSKANTLATLQNFGKKLLKVVGDARYLDKLDEVSKNKRKIKSLLNKNIPADLKTKLREIISINPKYINNIDDLVKSTSEIAKLLESPTLELRNGSDLAKVSDAYKNAQKILSDAEKLTKEYKEARIEAVKERLDEMGVDTSVIDNLYSGDPDALLEKLTKTLEDAKPKLVDAYRETAKVLKDMVEDIDLTVIDENGNVDFTKREIDFINDKVKNIDIDGVKDSNLPSLVAGLTNLVNYGSVTGLGDIVAKNEVYKKSLDENLIGTIQKAILVPKVWLQKQFDEFGSGSQRKDLRLKNQMKIPEIENVTGLSDLVFNTNNKHYKFVDGVRQKLVSLNKKYSKDFKNVVKNIQLGIYADVVQYRNSWTPEQITAEYGNRLAAWQNTLERLKLRAEQNSSFKAENENYIKNLEKALEPIIGNVERNDKGVVVSVEPKISSRDLFGLFDQGHKEFYKLSRESHDSIKDDFFFNARVNSNIDIEADWQNYTTRKYDFLGGNTNQLEALSGQAAGIDPYGSQSFSSINTAKSGSGKTRQLKGNQLPSESVLNGNFMDNFLPNLSIMSYDAFTGSDRVYIKNALDLKSSPVVEKFSDTGLFETYSALAEQKVFETVAAMQYGKSNPETLKRTWRTAAKLGIAQTLGGLFAAPKQFVEVVNIGLKTNTAFVQALSHLAGNTKDAVALIDQSNVKWRDAIYSELPQGNIKQRQFDGTNSRTLLRSLGEGVEKTIDRGTELSLKPLASVDKLTAKIGWLSFYIDYQKKNNEAGVDLSPTNVDRKAMDYANHMTSVTLNESDATMKSKFSKNSLVKTYLLFSSFAINSKMELISNTNRALSSQDGVSKGHALRNMMGNLAGIYAFNKVSQGLKYASIVGSGAAIQGVISSMVDDENKKKKLNQTVTKETDVALTKAEVSGTQNLLRDFLYGGIGGASLELIFNPVIDLTTEAIYTDKEAKDAELGRTMTPNALKVGLLPLGSAGLPIIRGVDAFKAFSAATQTDKDFILKRYGVLNAELNDIVVDEQRLTEEGKAQYGVPKYDRFINYASALSASVSMFGATTQEVGNMRRIATRITKELVKQDRGGEKTKDLDKAIRDAGIVDKITTLKQDYDLNPEQQVTYFQQRDKSLNEIKSKYPFEKYKNRLTKEEYEKVIRNVADKMAEQLTLQSMGEEGEALKETAVEALKAKANERKTRVDYQNK